jgi:hypothetical protein
MQLMKIVVCTITHPENLPSVICGPCGICNCQSGPWTSYSICTLVCHATNAEYSFPDDQPLQYFGLGSQLGPCGWQLELCCTYRGGGSIAVTKLTLLVLHMHFRYEIRSWVSFLMYLMSTFVPHFVTYGKIAQPDIHLNCCYFSFCQWSLDGMRYLDTVLPENMQHIEIWTENFQQYWGYINLCDMQH